MVKGKLLNLYFKPNSLSTNRVGCSIPNSRVKNLVQRNRLQRLIKEAYIKNSNIISGYDLIWTLRQGLSVSLSFKEVEWEVKLLIEGTKNKGG